MHAFLYMFASKKCRRIGENCLIGSNSVLIAPIKIGDSVTIGAGSILNKNVENNSLAISRVKQVNIKNWKKSNL